MKRLHLSILVIVLCLSGLGLFLYKIFALGFPLLPHTQTGVWNIEARVGFSANGPVRVGLFIPQKSDRFVIMNENFISRGYGVSALTAGVNRQARWSIREARGQQTLYYQTVVRQLAKAPSQKTEPAPELVYHDFEGAFREAAEALVSEIREKSADTETFVSELMLRLTQPATIKKLLYLSSTTLSDEDTFNLAVRLLSVAEIAARAVHGIRLEDQRREVPITHWLEFYDQDKWRTFDPFTGDLSVPGVRFKLSLTDRVSPGNSCAREFSIPSWEPKMSLHAQEKRPAVWQAVCSYTEHEPSVALAPTQNP